MKLTKEMNQLLRENYYTLVEDIRGDINKWREIPGSWMIKRNIAKSEKSPQTTPMLPNHSTHLKIFD